ncbi:MAG: hypothetical protein WDN47_00375 [Candidatus Doudnabacteria bacterium]
MKKAVKLINDIFIAFILLIFYFIFVGVFFVIVRFLNSQNKKAGSFWLTDDEKSAGFDLDSAY